MKAILRVRNCPKCKASWVDAEPDPSLLFAFEPGGFHSNLIGVGNGMWECKYCQEQFDENSFKDSI